VRWLAEKYMCKKMSAWFVSKPVDAEAVGVDPYLVVALTVIADNLLLPLSSTSTATPPFTTW